MDGPPYCFGGKVVLFMGKVRKRYLPRHKDVQGGEDVAPPSFTSALEGSEWSPSALAALPGGNSP
jgi:hypothetical protein